RFGHHIDEAARRTTELCRAAYGDDLKLLHRLKTDGELRPLAAALFAEERIIGVRAVNRNVVVNAFLAIDGNLISVRPLDNRDARREVDEAAEVTSIDRKVLYRSFIYKSALLASPNLDNRRIGFDRYGLFSPCNL